MCKLLFAVNHLDGDNKKMNGLIESQFAEMKDQPDGIGAIILTQSGELIVSRQLRDYDAVYQTVSDYLPQSRFVGLHTRIGTGGNVSVDNVHWFEHDGVLMAHNGFVPRYAPPVSYQKELGFVSTRRTMTAEEFNDDVVECNGCATTKDESGFCRTHRKARPTIKTDADKLFDEFVPCDSLAFLQAMPRPLTVESIREHAKSSRLSGFAIIVERATNKVWFIIEKDVLTITDDKTFDTYFSFEPDLESEKIVWKYRNGIPFIDKRVKTTIRNKPKTLSRGSFELTY